MNMSYYPNLHLDTNWGKEQRFYWCFISQGYSRISI